jgi:hypothetical protein
MRKVFLPRPRERGLAMPNVATQSTPPVGIGARAKIPGIGLFLIFLAFRASVRNGCARLWVSGQRMRRAPRKEPCHSQSTVRGPQSTVYPVSSIREPHPEHVTLFVHLYRVKAFKCGVRSAGAVRRARRPVGRPRAAASASSARETACHLIRATHRVDTERQDDTLGTNYDPQMATE